MIIKEESDPVNRMRRHYRSDRVFSASQMHADILELLDIIERQRAQMSPKEPQGIKTLPGQQTFNLPPSHVWEEPF